MAHATEADRLEAAVAAWLDNDDEIALPELASLAKAGNRDARILLGQIASRQHGSWLRSLNRGKRNELLRAPGGLSGKSWLEVLADEGDIHALALHTVFRPPFDFVKIQALIEYDEMETAIRLALRFSDHGGVQPEFAALPQAFGRDGAYAAYLPMIRHGIIRNFRLKGDLSDPAIWTPDALLMFGAFEDTSGGTVENPAASWLNILRGNIADGDPADAGTVGQMIDRLPPEHRNLKPARRFCDQMCPDRRSQCLATVTVLQRTGFNGLWAFSSPSNLIVSPERYYASERAIAEVRASLLERLNDPVQGNDALKWSDALGCLAS